MIKNVFLQYEPEVDYPKGNYNPSTLYPEYAFPKRTIQEKSNMVYDMIRNIFYRMKLDQDNYGMKSWNPLKEYIKPGDQVLIKPNLVMHFNGDSCVKENAMECLVTHPSCLRAICDYCLIALQGRGCVIIGDAPMQDCDFHVLMEKGGYNTLLHFYEEHNQPVTFVDFRKYQSTFNRNKVIIGKTYNSGSDIQVNLGEKSMHEKREGLRNYQVDNYDRHETNGYHEQNKHIYSINKEVLESDVIINFCKPKSHRLAGFTAAMKNMVGIVYNKASLPHRVAGSTEEGGDAYLYKSLVKRQIDWILDEKIAFENKHNIIMATIARYLYGALLICERKFGKDPYIKGIWYGNDTIWRTVVDLNYIERYADKHGEIQQIQQRKILNFADMVISGEHNGPCSPEPKKLGVILAAEDAAAMDIAICKMIGFPADKIPLINALINHQADYLLDDCTNIVVNSNYKNLNGELSCVNFPNKWRLIPHDNWSKVLG